MNQLRNGNKALSNLLSKYDSRGEILTQFTDKLPQLADSLYAEACSYSTHLFKRQNFLAKMFSGRKRALLATCIYELQLTAVFAELNKYFNDNALASLLIDALLFQATGEITCAATETDLMLGTQNIRGIHKYFFAVGRRGDNGDSEAWTFGKEYSGLVHNNPINGVHIISSKPYAIVVRYRARLIIKQFLYGVAPTAEDEIALKKLLEDTFPSKP